MSEYFKRNANGTFKKGHSFSKGKGEAMYAENQPSRWLKVWANFSFVDFVEWLENHGAEPFRPTTDDRKKTHSEAMAYIIEESKYCMNMAQQTALRRLIKALSDLRYSEYNYNRIEGMPAQSITQTTIEAPKPLKFAKKAKKTTPKKKTAKK